MMRSIYSSRVIVLAFTMILLLAGGCKSKKKAMEAAAAAEKAKMEQEATLRKQREAEERTKADAEAQERARREKAEAEAKAKAVSSTPAVKLGQYFSAISSATSPESANNSIKEALSLFATDQTPVLIVISESGGQKDYDKPTTIKDYLNYLKDQKKNINPVSDLEFDAAGKITSVELRKQN